MGRLTSRDIYMHRVKFDDFPEMWRYKAIEQQKTTPRIQEIGLLRNEAYGPRV